MAPPSASPTESPAANSAGWNTTDVPVTCGWTDNVGVKTTMSQIERTLWLERNQANEADAYAHPYDAIAEPNLRAASCSRMRPLGSDSYAPLWRAWYNSDGEQAEEPSEANQQLFALCDQYAASSPRSSRATVMPSRAAAPRNAGARNTRRQPPPRPCRWRRRTSRNPDR